jgi:cobalt-zinc-cadmium efflux system membrane fusion protein
MRAAGLLVLALLVAAGCGDSSSNAQPGSKTSAPPPPSEIKIVNPEYRTRESSLETTGKAQFNEERLVRVHAPLTGRVLEVYARPGDVVEPGHRLLLLDSADLGAAKSDYAKAVADAERSDAALKLARELYEVKAVAQKEIREAENDQRKAVAERQRAAARLRMLGIRETQFSEIAARADASGTLLVTASRAGVIVERNVTPGQVVAYGQSDTPVNLFVIADLGTMWVLADVYEPDVPKVKPGQHVTVTLPCCPGERYEGQVVNIGDSIDKDSRTLKVRVVVPNRGRSLKAEMFVKVSIATGSAQVLAVPQGAVHRSGGDTYVLVVKDKDAYERRSVKLGGEFNGMVEVLDGVAPEDRVVASGGILLKREAR